MKDFCLFGTYSLLPGSFLSLYRKNPVELKLSRILQTAFNSVKTLESKIWVIDLGRWAAVLT